MINNREDYYKYLKQDQLALGKGEQKRPSPVGDDIWKFQRLLRKTEYYNNCSRTVVGKIIGAWFKFRFYKQRIKYGFSIPLNVFGPGLSIAHIGSIVVNGNASIGENCRIQEGVTIGATNGSTKAPVLGNNVFIGSGAKIIGEIEIPDDVAIGANAVVVKTVAEPGITVAGAPAKKISNHDSHSNLLIFQQF